MKRNIICVVQHKYRCCYLNVGRYLKWLFKMIYKVYLNFKNYLSFSIICYVYNRIYILIFQPAHVKACFLGSNLTVPVSDGKLNLGTWQGVWLCEHRDRAGSRKVLVTVNGAIRDLDQRTPLSPNSPIASTSS